MSCNNMVSKSYRYGFTLIELLAVTSIVLLLAALLLPVFIHAREKAHQTTCASNLKQIGLSTIIYAQDNDDVIPFGGDPSDVDTDGWIGTQWATEAKTLPLITIPLAPYITNTQVWHCPDDYGYDEAGTFENTPLAAHPTAYASLGMSYEYDTYLVFMREALSSVTAWSKLVPHTEYGSDHIILFQDMCGSWHGGEAWQDKRYNVLFCDGHVHYTTRSLDSQLWHQTFTPPTGP